MPTASTLCYRPRWAEPSQTIRLPAGNRAQRCPIASRAGPWSTGPLGRFMSMINKSALRGDKIGVLDSCHVSKRIESRSTERTPDQAA